MQEIECHNKVDGICTIASYLARQQVIIQAVPETCDACSKCSNPKAINNVTCGLATLRLVEANLYNPSLFPHLGNCTNDYNESCINRPGTALRRLLSGMDVHAPPGCNCDQFAQLMDQWGYYGCIKEYNTIVIHLNSQKISWLTMAKVALHGYLTTESLVDKALLDSKPADFDTLNT